MFNEDKAFKLIVNDEIVGVVRVVRPPIQGRKRVIGYLVLFVAKQHKHDSEMQSLMYKELSFAARSLGRNAHVIYRVVLPFLPPYVVPDPLFPARLVKEFGSTALQRGSSVLLDEATGKPLF